MCTTTLFRKGKQQGAVIAARIMFIVMGTFHVFTDFECILITFFWIFLRRKNGFFSRIVMAMHDFFILKDGVLQRIVKPFNLSRCCPLGNEKSTVFLITPSFMARSLAIPFSLGHNEQVMKEVWGNDGPCFFFCNFS